MKHRKKRLSLLAVLLVLLGIAVFSAWLTRTDAGRDFALARVQGLLPDSAELRWKSVEGQLYQGLQFERLTYTDEDLRIEATTLGFKVSLSPLLYRKLYLKQINATHVRIDLPKDDTPFELPRWPDSLPALNLPLTIQAQKIELSDIRLLRSHRPIYALETLKGGLRISSGALQLNNINAESTDGSLHLNGSYLPGKDYKTRLTGSVKIKATGPNSPSLLLKAEGNAKQFLLDLEGAMPDPLRLRWQLQTQNNKPFWLFSGSTERFEPRYLGLLDSHAYRMQLAASGDSANAQLVGEVSRDGETVVIEPSRFALHSDQIRIEMLAAAYRGARVTASGSVSSGEALSSDGLDLTVQNFTLPNAGAEGAVPVTLDATAHWSGRVEQWQLKAQGALTRGDINARFTLQGNGTASEVLFPVVKLGNNSGGLDGQVSARWSPSPALAFKGALQRFDPSFIAADFPGSISADMKLEFSQNPDSQWQGKIQIPKLGGQLRQRKLAGTADVAFQGWNITGNADLNIGSSRILVQGQEKGKLAVNVQLQPLLLDDLNPNWRGRILGTLDLSGTRSSPDYRVDVNASALDISGYRAAHAHLQGDSLVNRATELTLEDLVIQDRIIERAQVLVTGHPRDAGLRLLANSGAYKLDLAGRLSLQTGKAALALQQALLETADFGTWNLQAPMRVETSARQYQFTPFCIVSLRSGANLCAEDAGANINISSDGLSLSFLEPWLNNTGKEFTYAGMASLRAELPKDFTFAGSGFADLSVPQLKVGVRSNTDAEVARIDDVQIRAKWFGRRLTGTVSAKLPKQGLIEGVLDTGFSSSDVLKGSLKLEVYELSWLELFSLDVAQPTGRITGEVAISGTRDSPLINGAYRLQDFNVQIPALGLKLSDGQITATSRDNLALLVRGSIKSGEGRMKVTGVWDPADQLPQPIDLRLTGDNVALADTPDMQLTADTDLLLGYAGGIYSLGGKVDITRGKVNLEALDTPVSASTDVVVLDPVPEKQHRDLLRLSIAMNVSVSDAVKVTGYGLNGSVSGKVAVNSPYNAPTKLTGTLNLTGKYESYGQGLEIKRGNLIYANSLVYEPRLDVLTERVIENEGVTVGLLVTGSAAKPKTRVVASPAMSDSDALSWLLFGRPLNTVNQSQAQSINARSMALNAGGSMLVGTLGRQIGLDQASISGSRTLGDSTLTLGKQLSPRLFVSYGVSLLGIGQVITLKYLLKKGLDISIESEQSELREQSSAALNWRK